MVRGAWCVVRGAWCVVRGAWCVVRGTWCLMLVRCAWYTVHQAVGARLARAVLPQEAKHRDGTLRDGRRREAFAQGAWGRQRLGAHEAVALHHAIRVQAERDLVRDRVRGRGRGRVG